MWDKSKVLVGTLWGIGQKLGKSLLSHTNPTHTPPPKNKIKWKANCPKVK
jgi:hypothetical protein